MKGSMNEKGMAIANRNRDGKTAIPPPFSSQNDHDVRRHSVQKDQNHDRVKLDRLGQTGGTTPHTNTPTVPLVRMKREELLGSRVKHLVRKLGPPTAAISETFVYSGITNTNDIELLPSPSSSSLSFSSFPADGSSKSSGGPQDISTTRAADTSNKDNCGLCPHVNVTETNDRENTTCGRHNDEDLEDELTSLIFSTSRDAHPPQPHDPAACLVVGGFLDSTLATESFRHPSDLCDDLSSLSDHEDNDHGRKEAAAEEPEMNGPSYLTSSCKQEKAESTVPLLGESCRKIPLRGTAIAASACSAKKCLTSFFLESDPPPCTSTSGTASSKKARNETNHTTTSTRSQEPPTSTPHDQQEQRNEKQGVDHYKESWKVERDKEGNLASRLLLQSPPKAKPSLLVVVPEGTRKSQRLLLRNADKEHHHHHVASKSRDDDNGKVIIVTEQDDQEDKEDKGESALLASQHVPVEPRGNYNIKNLDAERIATDKKEVQNMMMDQWYIHFQELVKYKAKHGHCNIAFRYKNGNPFLAAWVKRQRYQYKCKIRGKHSHLTDERERLLTELGFVWDSHVAAWEENFALMAEFYQRHGHCCVPIKQKELSDWAKRQRRRYKQNQLVQRSESSTTTTSTIITSTSTTLSEDRIRRLHKIQFFQPWARQKRTSQPTKEVGESSSHNRKRCGSGSITGKGSSTNAPSLTTKKKVKKR